MLKRIISCALVLLVLNLAGAHAAFAKTEAEKQARQAEKVKAGVMKLGTGEAARVKVKLRDKTKLEGYVGAAGEETFTVVNAKTGVASSVAYPQVKSVQGNNLSTGAKIAIGVGVAALVVFLIVFHYVVTED
ncbi:MAG TPA: hypothetical protein VGX48_21225 [Pyrinomonadaceae bacterium]|jgi:pectate lyase|nr:hypothetical protein [Pyrinomonadaceae bacterium]